MDSSELERAAHRGLGKSEVFANSGGTAGVVVERLPGQCEPEVAGVRCVDEAEAM